MLEICRPPYSPIRLLFNISPCLTCLFYLFPASHSLLAKKEEKKDRKKQEIEITLHSKQINKAYTIYCSIPCFTKFLEHPKTIPLPGQLITKAFLQVQLLDACKNIIQTGKWSDWSNLSQQKMTCIRPFLHLLDSIGLAASVFRSCLKSLPVTVMLLVGQFSFTKSHNGHVQWTQNILELKISGLLVELFNKLEPHIV